MVLAVAGACRRSAGRAATVSARGEACGVAGGAREDDLGALFARVTRRLIAAEEPILERHGLTMWEYVALTRVARGPDGNQLALAKAIHYDKTRLVRLLDRLEADGLVARTADPADRRSY